MSSPRPTHALFERIGAGFAAIAFWVEMLIMAESGHAMPGIPILAMLATPFMVFAVMGVGHVWIEDQGVKVVNTGRTFVIGWDEIERFSLGRSGPMRKVGIAELYDGRRIGIWGIQGPNAAKRCSEVAARRLIAAMNAELERRRPRATEPAVENDLEPLQSSGSDLHLVATA